jgi:plastocyanin
MQAFHSITVVTLSRWIFVLALFIAPEAVWATAWQAIAGAQSADKGTQALAFLPNELWVHVGDSITWTFPTAEIHTVTFLQQNTTPQQVRPPRPGVPGGGCPGTTPDGSSFDGSTCVTSSELVDGETYTVNFPTAGNFKFVCLVHPNMTGAVHVLDLSETLSHDQAFYDEQTHKEQSQLLADGARLELRGAATAQHTSKNEVTAGIGEIVATGGGSHTVSSMRFLLESIVVRVGDTVEWTNLDPVTPHTVTFGEEPPTPPGLNPPSAGVTVETDGARHTTLDASFDPDQDTIHSGFLVAEPQDRTGTPQTPLGITRFRVTFTTPGIFHYICALHDELGMKGRVIVDR